MNWVQKKPLLAIETIAYENHLCNTLPDLWHAFHNFYNYHKLHLAISPPILQQFPWSQWLRKALEKTFQLIPVMSRSNQYWLRY